MKNNVPQKYFRNPKCARGALALYRLKCTLDAAHFQGTLFPNPLLAHPRQIWFWGTLEPNVLLMHIGLKCSKNTLGLKRLWSTGGLNWSRSALGKRRCRSPSRPKVPLGCFLTYPAVAAIVRARGSARVGVRVGLRLRGTCDCRAFDPGA